MPTRPLSNNQRRILAEVRNTLATGTSRIRAEDAEIAMDVVAESIRSNPVTMAKLRAQPVAPVLSDDDRVYASLFPAHAPQPTQEEAEQDRLLATLFESAEPALAEDDQAIMAELFGNEAH